MKLYLSFTLFVILLLVAVVLGAQNSQLTEFNYLIAITDIRVASLVGIAMVLGALIASGFWMTYAVSLKMRLRANNKKFHQSLSNIDNNQV